MKNDAIFLRIEPETKTKFKEICKKERRSITALILLLIDKKINEVEDATVG